MKLIYTGPYANDPETGCAVEVVDLGIHVPREVPFEVPPDKVHVVADLCAGDYEPADKAAKTHLAKVERERAGAAEPEAEDSVGIPDPEPEPDAGAEAVVDEENGQ